jgi:VanZ family protein
MMKLKLNAFLPAIAWFIISFILLALPGKKLPQEHWFDKIQADKLVHAFLFGVLVYLWYQPWKPAWDKNFLGKALIICFLAFDYGVAMEFVQKYYVPNRSFDVWDIVADGVGCMLPYFWLRKKVNTAEAV